jgi:arginase
MSRILVPYHLDEHLSDLRVPIDVDESIRVDLPDGGDPWHRMATLYDVVATTVAERIRGGSRPVVVSGDCTASLAVMAGAGRAGINPGIVWFDAHGDVQTVETSASGYLGGMPLRILAGYRPELIGRRLGLVPVPPERILLVDARDLDPPEVDYLAGSAIGRHDVADVTDGVIPDGPLYLHLDLDILDPAELAGFRFPASGGPAATAVWAAARRVLETGRVVAIGLGCTWHPGHASDHLREPLDRLLTG